MRIHGALRLKLLAPTGAKDCPIPASPLESSRRAVTKDAAGRVLSSSLDDWAHVGPSEVRGQTAWKGETRFFSSEDQHSPFKALPQGLEQETAASSKLALQDLQLPRDPIWGKGDRFSYRGHFRLLGEERQVMVVSSCAA